LIAILTLAAAFCGAVLVCAFISTQRVFDSVPAAIMVASPDGAMLDLNRAAMRTFGYETREEAMTIRRRTSSATRKDMPPTSKSAWGAFPVGRSNVVT
jgi:hypothetical protein